MIVGLILYAFEFAFLNIRILVNAYFLLNAYFLICFSTSICAYFIYVIFVQSPVFSFFFKTCNLVGNKMRRALANSGYLDHNPDTACLYIYATDSVQSLRLDSLSHWRGDGRNHVVINTATSGVNPILSSSPKTGRALIAQPSFQRALYRPSFDLVLPELGPRDEEVWKVYPSMIPITRKFLLSFQGELVGEAGGPVDHTTQLITQHLQRMADVKNKKTKDEVSLAFKCGTQEASEAVEPGDWLLCNDVDKRFDILQQSTFSLVIVPSNSSRYIYS